VAVAPLKWAAAKTTKYFHSRRNVEQLLKKAGNYFSSMSIVFFVRASSVGFAIEMHEVQFAFSLAGLMGARPLPEFY
jgi:hypothetical protein